MLETTDQRITLAQLDQQRVDAQQRHAAAEKIEALNEASWCVFSTLLLDEMIERTEEQGLGNNPDDAIMFYFSDNEQIARMLREAGTYFGQITERIILYIGRTGTLEPFVTHFNDECERRGATLSLNAPHGWTTLGLIRL